MRDLKRLVVFLSVLWVLLFACLFESFRFFPIERISFNFPLILRMGVLILNVLVLSVLLYGVCSKKMRVGSLSPTLFIVFYGLAVVFCLLEGLFIFYPKSHSTGNTALSNIAWASYYNKPLNEYNFRGGPIVDLEGKKKIYVLGDSYTCGWGIADVNERYPELLEKRLGQPWRVINMGVPGFGTKEELYVLNKFLNVYDLKKPDLVIWQYLVNDILSGSSAPPFLPYAHEGAVAKYFIENSFFFNFLYWSFPRDYNADYTDYLLKNFLNDPKKVQAHINDVLLLVRMCQESGVHLIVVGFPYLSDLEKTCPMISSLEQLFSGSGIEFVNICAVVKDVPSCERVIHDNDQHPSLYVHQLVAQELFLRMKKIFSHTP